MNHEPFQSAFAHTIFKGKYPFTPDETWSGCAERVTKNVMAAVYTAPNRTGHAMAAKRFDPIFGLIDRREFIPGGRYLYGAGRDFHQVQNCLLMRAEDSREGWSQLKYNSMMALMTGAGIGVYYGDVRGSNSAVGRTGGRASGPIPLMESVNEDGRASVQGGDRRCAIWAGLPWNHPDIHAFIGAKDWPAWLREQKDKDPTVRAPMDMTNISVCLDDEFFDAYKNDLHPLHCRAHKVYWRTVDKMVTTGEPGFSVDTGKNAGEVLRNAPVAGETMIMTRDGYRSAVSIAGKPTDVWTGQRWASNVVFARTRANAAIVKVAMTGGRSIRCDPSHPFMVESWVCEGRHKVMNPIRRVPAQDLVPGDRIHVSLPLASDESVDRASAVKVLSVSSDGVDDVFCADVRVPEHSFMAEGVIVSNCTEITSADDSDVCNLGSLVLPRFSSPKHFGGAVRDAVLFLTAGTLYSDVSYAKVAEVREKNRRLGLGIIGVHEFCLMNGVKYGSPESFEVLEPYMREYDRALEHAWYWQDHLTISRSVAATAIAPNGTIGILAESTPSGDPMYSAAREKVVITSTPGGDIRTVHVLIDPVAKRLVELGVRAETIEDAYSLANAPDGLDRRLAMQAYLQSHVDQAVSSTVNLPHVMRDKQEQREFGETLMRYLPQLRGVTAYPDGARAGQPNTPVPLAYALEHEGESWIEGVEDTCRGGVCGV